jgi:hypothetical protein
MKPLIYNTTFLFFLVFVFITTIISCKKEKDDPNITYRSINKTITNSAFPTIVLDSVDFDGNGISDFFFNLGRISVDSFFLQFYTNDASLNVDTTTLLGAYYLINITTGSTTPLYVSGSDNYSPIGVVSYKYGANFKGIAGKGDKYISFGYPYYPSNIHYGWMKVNFSADYKTFKIIDCAYSTLANTPTHASRHSEHSKKLLNSEMQIVNYFSYANASYSKGVSLYSTGKSQTKRTNTN